MSPNWLPLALVGALVFLGWLAWSAQRAWARLRRRHRWTRARRAESDAAALLARHGYRVIREQLRCAWPVRHGERLLQLELRADYLVERRGHHWIAEVKSTPAVSDLRHGPTRRQLLEYLLAFEVDGVLLVDTHARRVQRVDFPGLARGKTQRRASRLSSNLLLAAVIAAALFGSAWQLWRQRHERCDQLGGKGCSAASSSNSRPSRSSRLSLLAKLSTTDSKASALA